MKKVLSFFVVFCCILCLAGCAASNDKGSYPAEGATTSRSDYKNYSYSTEMTTEDISTTSDTVQTDRKLIKKINMKVETAGYGEYITSLRTAVAEAGGYVQRFEELEGSRDTASCSFVIRIPAEKTDAFLNVAGSGVTVISRSEDMSDVTGEYVDIQARMTALEAEEKSLLALLERAESVSEILTVRERLSDVRSDIESFKAQLNSYDNLTSYSTVNLSVFEVARETEKESVWARIGNNFVDAGNNIGNFFVDVFVFILAALPYIAIIAVPGIVVLIIIIRKRRAKK